MIYILALFASLFVSSAQAQPATTCATRPSGDNSNACASTAFVRSQNTAIKTYIATQYGMKCDDVTDDTAAFNALNATVASAGGGTIIYPTICRINGQYTHPTAQTSIIWSGEGTGGLDLRYNASVAKLLLLGNPPPAVPHQANLPILEVRNMIIKDSGSDCSPFWFVSNTILASHDNTYIGTAATTSACNDTFLWGGTGSLDTSSNAAFQAYGSYSRNDTFAQMRRIGVFRAAANGISMRDMHVDFSNGNGTTQAITSATNGNPAVMTIGSSRFASGQTFTVTLSGFTGSWASANGTFTATATGDSTFSIPINSTTFGAISGTPSIPDGEAFLFDGGVTFGSYGNIISGIIELTNYSYVAKLSNGGWNNFSDIGLYDQTNGFTIGYFDAIANYVGGYVRPAYYDPNMPMILGSSINRFQRPELLLGSQICAQGFPSFCPDVNAMISTQSGSGQTAAHFNGVAAGMYVDYLGSGTNYYDANQHSFRSFTGTQELNINSTGVSSALPIISQIQLCANQTASYCNDLSAAFSVANGPGKSAVHIAGQAANMYVDYLGSGSNYIEGATTYIRTFGGAPIAEFSSTGLSLSGALTVGSSTMISTTTSFSNAAGANTGTLTNSPIAGNPTKWIAINDNGVTRYIPAW